MPIRSIQCLVDRSQASLAHRDKLGRVFSLSRTVSLAVSYAFLLFSSFLERMGKGRHPFSSPPVSTLSPFMLLLACYTKSIHFLEPFLNKSFGIAV